MSFGRIGGDAAQDDIVIDRVDGDARARNGALDQILQGQGIARDLEIEAEDLATFGIEEEHVRLSQRAAEEIGPVLRADDGIDDGRIADDDVFDRGRQLDDHGLADA